MSLKENTVLVLRAISLLVVIEYASSKSNWYFDAKQEKCYRFFYGGCQGNGNRFPSQSDCLDRCYVNSNLSKNPIPQFCNLAFDYGHCFGQYNRWGWDPLYKGCRRRLYSGCGGNQNNFETLSECMATCLVGPANSMTQMKTYTTCIPFTIGEKRGNQRNGISLFCICKYVLNSRRLIAKRKVCLLRPDNGPCRADVISWYYDARKRKCYRFFYGGCQGNGNNFVSEEICKETCYLSTRMRATHQPYFCQLTFDYGTCFGQYNRWHWDHISGHCRRRLYSGCGGNQNNFETKQECMANCLTTPNNTLNVETLRFTTCIPFTLAEFS
ncbi:hypothetical protein SFRURICE_007686 [Spodoptera frugiperda]|nr:hypothetical protein SFRURICE_007686 [Spodoptera frugiperda]